MTDLLAARSQMAMSLGFHIVFACVGIGMPLLMVMAERRWRKTRDPVYRDLAKRWAYGTAIMFAVGAVSGTVLSFELGLLWPEFMRLAGPVIGMPFSLEGFAFFLEAIFLGIYLYGWDRVSERMHFGAGVGVLVSGALSGIFVVTANAWMNTPAGFTLDETGAIVDIDPFGAMLNPAAFTQTLHMTIAAFVAVGFAVAGLHAWRLRKHPDSAFDLRAYRIALVVGGVAALLQPLSGDLSAKHIAEHQPYKLAAAEGHWETGPCAPLLIGGIPDEEDEVTRFAIEIPCGLSVLAHFDPDAVVPGLKDIPPEDRPPVLITHLAFQIMVGAGVLMALVAFIGFILWWRRKRPPTGRRYLLAVALCSPLGFIAVEAGWVVTEVGRQPFVIGAPIWMRTADAVTPMEGLTIPFLGFTALYIVLAVTVVVLLRRHVFRAPVESRTLDHAPPDAPRADDEVTP